jgi:hypothetical protein
VIAGLLVLGLLVTREVVRSDDPTGSRTAVVNRLLLPASIGLAAIAALRLVDLVVGGA